MRGREAMPCYRRKVFCGWWPVNSAACYQDRLPGQHTQFTFRVLCGFLILDDFLMSTSVVFTHPGWKWKNRETKKSLGVKGIH
jgi:hypothetical protein